MLTESKKPRVALFVESHEGYGHFNIVSQLAKELEAKGVEVMVLCGTLNYAGAGQTFDFGTARVVNLPLVDYRVVKGGKWEYVTPDQHPYEESPEYIAQRKTMIKAAIADFQPDLVVSELFPFMQFFRKHDMEAVDELKKEGTISADSVSLCRDIIHNNDPQKVLGMLDEHFKQILVRGDKRFATLVESQSEWQDIKTPVEYMGNYITSMPEKTTSIPDNERHVVVFGGGDMPRKTCHFLKVLFTQGRALKNLVTVNGTFI